MKSRKNLATFILVAGISLFTAIWFGAAQSAALFNPTSSVWLAREIGSAHETLAFDTATNAQAYSACPVTTPSAAFVPPAPYPQVAPWGNFWYGSASLWLMLPPDGTWTQLRYGDKMFWWSSGYTASAEPKPALKISGKRLDGNETFEISDATNAYHSDFGGWAMLAGVQAPTSGCWEIRGEYHKTSTTFVVQVLP